MGKFYAGVCEDLILYAKQFAWFSAKPKKPDVPGAVAKRDGSAQELTRAQDMIARGGTPLMPPLEDAAYILSYWQELGMVESNGMGATPLSAREIAAWQEGSGIMLQAWEFHILREMSRAYLAQLHESEKPDCPPPYGDPVNNFDREVVSKKVSNAFQAFMQAKRK